MSIRAVEKLIERYVKTLGLDPNVTVHSLRVTALTTARERGLYRTSRDTGEASALTPSERDDSVSGIANSGDRLTLGDCGTRTQDRRMSDLPASVRALLVDSSGPDARLELSSLPAVSNLRRCRCSGWYGI